MTAPRRHGNGEGGFGRTAGDAAFRGALLIGVAVIIGLLLLWRAHDTSASSTGLGPTPTTTAAHPAATTTRPPGATTTVAPGATGATGASGATGATAVTHSAGQVKVLVANGTGTPSGAGLVTQKLIPQGYATLAAANASSATVTTSKIYYREGYSADAKQVAVDLGVAAPVESIIEAMPATPPVAANAADRAASAHVLVLLGTDGKIKQT